MIFLYVVPVLFRGEGIVLSRTGIHRQIYCNISLCETIVNQNYGKKIAEKTAPFSQNAIPLKDVGLFKTTAQQVESPTPIASLLHHLLRSDEARA